MDDALPGNVRVGQRHLAVPAQSRPFRQIPTLTPGFGRRPAVNGALRLAMSKPTYLILPLILAVLASCTKAEFALISVSGGSPSGGSGASAGGGGGGNGGGAGGSGAERLAELP